MSEGSPLAFPSLHPLVSASLLLVRPSNLPNISPCVILWSASPESEPLQLHADEDSWIQLCLLRLSSIFRPFVRRLLFLHTFGDALSSSGNYLVIPIISPTVIFKAFLDHIFKNLYKYWGQHFPASGRHCLFLGPQGPHRRRIITAETASLVGCSFTACKQ